MQPTPPDAVETVRRFASEQEERAWLALVEVHARVSRALDHALDSGHQISKNAFDLLMRIAHGPSDEMTVGELAADAAVSQSQVSRLVIDLERRGLVSRDRKASDARATCVRLSDAGYAFIAEAAPAYLSVLRDEFFDRLQPGDAAQLAELLARTLPRDE